MGEVSDGDYGKLSCFRVARADGVAFVTIDHPPINLLDLRMSAELNTLVDLLERDAAIRVIVFRSANPDFFVAHFDIEVLRDLHGKPLPGMPGLSSMNRMLLRFRSMPKVSIAQLEGRARGGGSEIALALDMRFGAIGRAILAQPEVALGIIPGAGGTQRLARLVGRGRALEVLLGCADIDAVTAERYGYINRALPPSDLAPFVESLACLIASFPLRAIAAAKEAVAFVDAGLEQGLKAEQLLFTHAAAAVESRERMARAMELGAQTLEVERDGFAELLAALAPRVES